MTKVKSFQLQREVKNNRALWSSNKTTGVECHLASEPSATSCFLISTSAASGTTYEIHIQKLDVLVLVTTVKYMRLFSNSMATWT